MTNKDLEDSTAGNNCSTAIDKKKSIITLDQIFQFLTQNPNIIFKSQQIDDPELTLNEKKAIASQVLQSNPKTFIMRFGPYLDIKHIDFFQQFEHVPAQDQDEFNYLLENLQKNFDKRKSCVKNRRYTATQQMHEYFSETEMMKREPHLYHELVGQYLSKEERTQRDAYDVKQTSFSGILLNKMDRDNAAEVLQKHQEDIQDDENNDSSLEDEESSEDEAKFGQSYSQQWGNFDDENIPCSSSKVIKKQKKAKKRVKQQKFITAGEREILRQEFVGIMKAKFLNGEDKEFDYNEVDNNAELDDLQQLNQDKEDEYFGESSEEDCIERMDDDDDDDEEKKESDDDLDVYMSHLNRHHSLQPSSMHLLK